MALEKRLRKRRILTSDVYTTSIAPLIHHQLAITTST
jgi:hypothetical protein